MNLTLEQIFPLLRQVGLPESEWARAAAIAQAESGLRTDAVANYPNGSPGGGPEVSVGLWQINTIWHKQFTPDQLLDPLTNAQEMMRVSQGGKNWNPWSVYTNGAYQRYLADAQRALGTAGAQRALAAPDPGTSSAGDIYTVGIKTPLGTIPTPDDIAKAVGDTVGKGLGAIPLAIANAVLFLPLVVLRTVADMATQAGKNAGIFFQRQLVGLVVAAVVLVILFA